MNGGAVRGIDGGHGGEGAGGEEGAGAVGPGPDGGGAGPAVGDPGPAPHVGQAVVPGPARHTWLLEGAELKYDPRPGSYRRMKVNVCPTHGKNCSKSRAFSEKFGRRSGLGDEEPFAYLGCWLRMGEDLARFPDAETHKKEGWPDKQGPSTEEVQEYARSMGWM